MVTKEARLSLHMHVMRSALLLISPNSQLMQEERRPAQISVGLGTGNMQHRLCASGVSQATGV